MAKLKVGCKVLNFDWARFLLPDDFDGRVSDALRLLADYLESPTDKPKPTQKIEKSIQAFVKAVEEGNRCVGAVQLMTLVEKDKGGLAWQKFDTGIVYDIEGAD